MLYKEIEECKLCTSKNIEIFEIYNSEQTIHGYSNAFGVEVERFFLSEEYSLIKCLNCGLNFFDGSVLPGDASFYQELSTHDWYYMPWKWEHEAVSRYIDGSMKVLEIGCGTGSFIREAKKRTAAEIQGLELNKASIKKAKEAGLLVYDQLVEDFSFDHQAEFDVVCSFQVAEHINSIDTFIQGQIDCLKSGGKLIISVPNNNSFIRKAKNDLLNRPPHHSILWTEETLSYITQIYSLEKIDIIYEPLQDYHFDWYISTNLALMPIFFQSLFRRLRLRFFTRQILKVFRKSFHGHTIIFVAKKL